MQRTSPARTLVFLALASIATSIPPRPASGAAASYWTTAPRAASALPDTSRFRATRHLQAWVLDRDTLATRLGTAPIEGSIEARRAPAVIELPLPDGTLERFAVVESPMMEPDLARQFPDIRTWAARGIDDATATARLDLTPAGFHALILSERGRVFVDPEDAGDASRYVSYYSRDYRRADGTPPPRCLVNGDEVRDRPERTPLPDSFSFGTERREYRAAFAATGEYTAFFGGTVPQALAAITTTVNRVNTVYERDLSVRLILVANQSSIIYTDRTTDPYANLNASLILNQNQSNLDTVIGSANYDIGHVLTTGSGGLAQLSVICSSSSKAKGTTGTSNPVGDPFDIDFVAHEVGHQFGGPHTFNGTTSNCSGNRSAGSAYEPGSGSTIMAYAGICGAENLQPHSDDYFHVGSLNSIITHIIGSGGTCAVHVATGNTPPAVSVATNVHSIPKGTPFTLTASASDANGDAVSYCWEELDLGTASPPADDDGSRPLFRSFLPTSSPSRTFPRLADILSGQSTNGELMPVTSRSMKFRVTARDNRSGGGGIHTADVTLDVRGEAGPFRVTEPAGGATVEEGGALTVRWDVANTTAAPINAQNVEILLSTDGGTTFSKVLSSSTPNDGVETVSVPCSTATTRARVKVSAAGNVFFDISHGDFTITANSCADPTVWHDFFAVDLRETPMVGDFNGDGKTDIITFTRDNPLSFGDVYVALSEGTRFGNNQKWNDWFAISPSESVVIGDFTGDGKEDIATWLGDTTRQVYVAPSAGSGMLPSELWLDAIGGAPGDVLDEGDVNGDGKADLILFARSAGKVDVALSTGTGFSPPTRWHEFFAVSTYERPRVGDVDGDGKADIITFASDSPTAYGDVYVSLSTGTSFEPISMKWHDFFSVDPAQVLRVGDVNGDKRDDFFTFMPRPSNQVYMAQSQGTSLGPNLLREVNGLTRTSTDLPFVGDANGDGKTDLIVFHQTEGKVRVHLTP